MGLKHSETNYLCEVHRDVAWSNMSLHDIVHLLTLDWTQMNVGMYHNAYCRYAGNFMFPRRLLKVGGVFHAQHTKQNVPPLRLHSLSKLHHHSGLKLPSQRVLSITCWHERHTKTLWYITWLNWEAQLRLRNVVRVAQLIIMKHKEMLTDWLRILIEGALRNRFSSLWWKTWGIGIWFGAEKSVHCSTKELMKINVFWNSCQRERNL